MGEIIAKIRIENQNDTVLCEAGKMSKKNIRAEYVDVVVDTGAVMMMLPLDVVTRLGLRIKDQYPVILADGQGVKIPTAGDFIITVRGRSWTTDCLVGPAGSTPLLGQLVMERLRLIADPAHRALRLGRYPLPMRGLEPALA